MADAVSIIPAAVLRSITDKLYEKRKVAALEVCVYCVRNCRFFFESEVFYVM